MKKKSLAFEKNSSRGHSRIFNLAYLHKRIIFFLFLSDEVDGHDDAKRKMTSKVWMCLMASSKTHGELRRTMIYGKHFAKMFKIKLLVLRYFMRTRTYISN